MSKGGRLDLSKTTQAEHGFKVKKFITKSVASLAPGGGILSEVFDLVITDPAVRRRDQFITDLDERLTALEDAGLINLADIANSEAASTLLLHAIQVAARAAGKEKLQSLRNTVENGLTSKAKGSIERAQVVLNYVDRMTDYHVILLKWKCTPNRPFTLGEMKDGIPGAHESLFYGQPVSTKPDDLQAPHQVGYGMTGMRLYVEHGDVMSFEMAKSDLASMGLLSPVYQEEQYTEGRQVKHRNTNIVVDYVASETGKSVWDYIKSE